MYSLVSLLTHVYMYLSKHFLYERLEVFQLEALSCYLFQTSWIPFLFHCQILTLKML
jgi:hypothetical protein